MVPVISCTVQLNYHLILNRYMRSSIFFIHLPEVSVNETHYNEDFPTCLLSCEGVFKYTEKDSPVI